MKPGIPETGIVIRLDGDNAVVRMTGDGSCRNCGVAAAGMCTGALRQLVTVGNMKRARVGDAVKIGLVRRTQFKGYFLAYVIPSLALVFGSGAGTFLGGYADIRGLDAVMGFTFLITASYYSYRRLRRLDAVSSIDIVSVLSDRQDTATSEAEQRTISDYYLSSY